MTVPEPLDKDKRYDITIQLNGSTIELRDQPFSVADVFTGSTSTGKHLSKIFSGNGRAVPVQLDGGRIMYINLAHVPIWFIIERQVELPPPIPLEGAPDVRPPA